MTQQIKKDKFTENRRGYSDIFSLKCSDCGEEICKYQKDGGGYLYRLYIDRINDVSKLSEFGVDKKMYCKKCNKLIGLGGIYTIENRECIELFNQSLKVKPVNYIRHIYCKIMSIIKPC